MNLRNRHFLKLLDFAPGDLEQLIGAALTLKRLKLCGQERKTLTDRQLGLFFQKSGIECSWTVQVAASSQGLSVNCFGPGQTGIGPEHSMNLTGRHLGRLFDIIGLYGMEQESTEEIARLSGIPTINLGSNEFQPFQVLADFVTMTEHSSKSLPELSVLLLGDGQTSVAQSLLLGASKLGIDLRWCGPKSLQPEEHLIETSLALGAETGAQIRLFTEPEEAVKGADFVFSQSWRSGDHTAPDMRVDTLLPYRATSELLHQSGQARCRLLHRLPLVMGEETFLGREVAERHNLDGLEVSRELFESAASLLFEQAENQLHTCKAVLASLLS